MRKVFAGLFSSLDGVVDSTAATSAIQVRQLTKTYPGGVEAVKGIDFDVAAGEVFGLLGPNGAGKSTTVGRLTTTVAPTSGHARVAGFDVTTEPLAARHASAVVFQEPVVDRLLTGRRNLSVHARLWGLDRAAAAVRVGSVVRPGRAHRPARRHLQRWSAPPARDRPGAGLGPGGAVLG